MVTCFRPNTYDHAKKLAISLTNHLSCQKILIKKEDDTRDVDNKRKYNGSSTRTSNQSSWKKQETKKGYIVSTTLYKPYIGNHPK